MDLLTQRHPFVLLSIFIILLVLPSSMSRSLLTQAPVTRQAVAHKMGVEFLSPKFDPSLRFKTPIMIVIAEPRFPTRVPDMVYLRYPVTGAQHRDRYDISRGGPMIIFKEGRGRHRTENLVTINNPPPSKIVFVQLLLTSQTF